MAWATWQMEVFNCSSGFAPEDRLWLTLALKDWYDSRLRSCI